MEELYTIPVNDAFDLDTECPVCAMRQALEADAIEFTMGPSYMEDDVRMETDRIGFCGNHVKLLYQNQNRLGLALMLLTHMERTMKDLTKLSAAGAKPAGGLFRKKEVSAVKAYTDKLESSCYICDRINRIFGRYIATVFYLYQKDKDFVKKFQASKGFCLSHYGLLYEEAGRFLGSRADDFRKDLNQVYLENMKRVRDDLEWFTDKFDYRYVNEPWKNSKDALIRSALKMNSVEVEEKKKE